MRNRHPAGDQSLDRPAQEYRLRSPPPPATPTRADRHHYRVLLRRSKSQTATPRHPPVIEIYLRNPYDVEYAA